MRFSRIFVIQASAALAAILLSAQGTAPKGGTTTGSTGGSTGTTGLPSTGTLPSTTLPSASTSTAGPGAPGRGAFFYGKVVMPDGSAPTNSVVIERVCNSVARPQAYTDSNGNFSFQVGQTQDMLPDATESSASGKGSQPSPRSSTLPYACDLRAVLGGYRSDLISLAGRRTLDDPNIGTIILHPYSKVEGLTTSATSALAPKDAQKAFTKGLEALKKSKLDEAQNDFLKATDIYPRYASAWLELGGIYELRGQMIEAREAYRRSIAADSKFVNPYERMYMLSFTEKKWEDLAATTEKVMRLNPYDFPEAVYFNAVANSQLGRLDVAEKSAREAIAMGTEAKNPKVNYILGVILAKKQDFKGAAECLRTYLKSDAVTDRDQVAKLLADVEKQVEAKAQLKPEP
jgi:tetratricopeptide (TPR) repeat protein